MKHSTIPVVHSTIPFHHSIPPNVDTHSKQSSALSCILVDYERVRQSRFKFALYSNLSNLSSYLEEKCLQFCES